MGQTDFARFIFIPEAYAENTSKSTAKIGRNHILFAGWFLVDVNNLKPWFPNYPPVENLMVVFYSKRYVEFQAWHGNLWHVYYCPRNLNSNTVVSRQVLTNHPLRFAIVLLKSRFQWLFSPQSCWLYQGKWICLKIACPTIWRLMIITPNQMVIWGTY